MLFCPAVRRECADGHYESDVFLLVSIESRLSRNLVRYGNVTPASQLFGISTRSNFLLLFSLLGCACYQESPYTPTTLYKPRRCRIFGINPLLILLTTSET